MMIFLKMLTSKKEINQNLERKCKKKLKNSILNMIAINMAILKHYQKNMMNKKYKKKDFIQMDQEVSLKLIKNNWN